MSASIIYPFNCEYRTAVIQILHVFKKEKEIKPFDFEDSQIILQGDENLGLVYFIVCSII